MKLISIVRTWWRATMYHERVRDEVNEEMSFHLDARASDLERAGLTADAARRQARIEMGLPEQQGERYREAIGLRWLDELGGDLRYAWRMLWRSKGFTAVAVGSLALGIGANTIIFSLAKGVLLDRLAVPHPEQLRSFNAVLVMSGSDTWPLNGIWDPMRALDSREQRITAAFSYPEYRILRRQNAEHPVMEDLFAYKEIETNSPQINSSLTVTVDGNAALVSGQIVSGNYYTQLKVRPQLGRPIGEADDLPGANSVVTISDGMWSRVFARSPRVIGKVIRLNLVPVTIVGVNPPGFAGAGDVQVSPDVFYPFSLQPQIMPTAGSLENPDNWWIQIMARTKSGVAPEMARTALETWLAQDIRAMSHIKNLSNMPTLRIADGAKGLRLVEQQFGGAMRVLVALTGLVLLLTCTNLANLLLARSSVRQREMAVRLALGATRRRVLRQVLTESLLLSSLGGLAGVAVAYLGRNIVPHLFVARWETVPVQAKFDLATLFYSAGIILLTGVLFGVAPAWQATRVQVNVSLKDAAASATRRRRGIGGRGLVIVQVTLSMLLVVSAGLFAQTLHRLYTKPIGFDTSNLLLFAIDAPQGRYPKEKAIALHQRIEEQLRATTGVEAVAMSTNPMVANKFWNQVVRTDVEEKNPRANHIVYLNMVSESFFTTYGIPMVSGRGFASEDTPESPQVVIISRGMALKLFPGENPIGRTIQRDFMGNDPQPTDMRIVGIAEDTRYATLEGETPQILYMPYGQLKDSWDFAQETTYAIRTRQGELNIVPRVREAVAQIDRDLPLRDVRTQKEQVNATVSQPRTFAVLSGAFGVLALVLACIGIYGLMAYEVSRRTNEIGIRMALGARAGQILAMVLREVSWVAVAGVAIGLGAALTLGRFVQSMLYGVTAHDPWVLGGAAVVLLLVALAAGFGPARRAARVEPMIALRHE